MERIEYLVNHWSVTNPYVRVADIRRMHLQKGWRDIGYHRIILHPLSGDLVARRQKKEPLEWWDLVKQGRPLDEDLYIEQEEQGAHTLYYNHNSVGICIIGHPSYKLHPLQVEAIIQTNFTLQDRFILPINASVSHRDFNPTECPGDEIYKLIVSISRG